MRCRLSNSHGEMPSSSIGSDSVKPAWSWTMPLWPAIVPRAVWMLLLPLLLVLVLAGGGIDRVCVLRLKRDDCWLVGRVVVASSRNEAAYLSASSGTSKNRRNRNSRMFFLEQIDRQLRINVQIEPSQVVDIVVNLRNNAGNVEALQTI